MKYIQYGIKERFLQQIRSGKKQHEYRLAKHTDIHVGDVLVLISNQDESNYIKVVINHIDHYNNWEDALSEFWQKDFEGLYDSFDDLLKECKSFNSREDVEKYGINVFEIKHYSKSFKNSSFLLDTNVIIERESSNNVSSEVAYVYKWIDKIGGKRVVHPLSKEELSKHRDENVRNVMLTKLGAYEELVPSVEDSALFRHVCSTSEDPNTEIDHKILLQVFNGTADYLITSDRGILRKAKQLYIDDCVLSPNEFLVRIEKEYPSLIEYNVLSVKLVKVGSLRIDDPFFNTLRKDYGEVEFNEWLRKKNREEAYVFINNDGLQGFLYLKIEGPDEPYDDFEPVLLPAKRLKVGTFKTNSLGFRLGERFLKIIFDNALENKVDEIYVTMFENNRDEVKALRDLMEQWGFVKKGIKKSTGEIYLVKDMKNYDQSKCPKFNYPLQKNNKRVMFLPIKSQYHTKLFPDLYLKNEDMHLYDEEACRYAIEKIYVCAYFMEIQCKKGDLVCIYRMGDYNPKYTSVVSGIGIVQDVLYPPSEEEFISECQNKSVFSKEELKEFYASGRYRSIIKILFLKGLKKKVILDSLYRNGILSADTGARINTFIPKEKFDILKDIGGLNE